MIEHCWLKSGSIKDDAKIPSDFHRARILPFWPITKAYSSEKLKGQKL